VDVRWARVSTLGATVVDSFSIAGADLDRKQIERAVLAAAR